MKNVLNPSYKFVNSDPKVNKQNIQNLQKSFFISTIKNQALSKTAFAKVPKLQKQYGDMKNRTKMPKVDKTKKYLKNFLVDETQ